MPTPDSCDIFEENERRVLRTLTRVMRWLWVTFPFIYLGNVVGLFQIEYRYLNISTAITLVVLWLPTIMLQHWNTRQNPHLTDFLSNRIWNSIIEHIICIPFR